MRKLFIRLLFGKKLSVIEELHAAERHEIYAFFSLEELAIRQKYKDKLKHLTSESVRVNSLLLDAIQLAEVCPDRELEKWIRDTGVAALNLSYGLVDELNLANSELEKASKVFDNSTNAAMERMETLRRSIPQ